MTKLIRVFCVAGVFLPGFRGGGPIRTLTNMRDQLSKWIELSIFTRDRDLGEKIPYENISIDQWSFVEGYRVYYASPRFFGIKGAKKATSEYQFDILYLNSFFDFHGSIQIYFLFRKIEPNIPIILAPRGEFSPGALSIKWLKKKIFLSSVKLFGFYKDIRWHASTEQEAQDILKQFPNALNRIYIAKDPVAINDKSITREIKKETGQLRMIFLSRISPMKNLDGLLNILKIVKATITLSIYGPIEDNAYWEKCKKLISTLPKNIKATYCGIAEPNKVFATFASYDLFAFPTHGENFGHVIIESLRSGTPILLSDKTSFHADELHAITVIPANDQKTWADAIEKAAARNQKQQSQLREAALNYFKKYLEISDSIDSNLAMFRSAISQSQ